MEVIVKNSERRRSMRALDPTAQRSVYVTVAMTPRTARLLRKEAQLNGMPLAALTGYILEQALDPSPPVV